MFALDANALIHALKGKGRVRERLLAVPPQDIAIPAVALYEIEFGTLCSRDPENRRNALARLTAVTKVLPFDRQAADHSSQLRMQLKRRGLDIGPLDTLIAGTALAHGAVLITHNLDEFSRVPGLRVEDWF